MDSISNTFSNFYTTENIGNVQLGNANLNEILSALLTEYRIMEHSVKTVGTSTPQGAFHNVILEGLQRIGYIKILKETAELVNYISHPKFGMSTIGATLGYMAKRTKENFDIRFDLSFTELNQTLDNCKLTLVIKAHRLFLAELCKKITRTYNPDDIDSSKAIYRKFSGEAEQIRNGKTVTIPTFTEHSSADFSDYASYLKQIYTKVYAYSDTMSEFIKIFVDAVATSKQVSSKLTEERRPKTIAEQRGSPKVEKKERTEQKTQKTHREKKVVPINNTNVKTAPPPTVNAWSKRQAEFELITDLVAEQEPVDAEIEVVAEVNDKADVESESESEAEPEFIEVSRKKTTTKATEKKPYEKKSHVKGISRTKVLATIA
jgi:hypothetical protein